MKKSMSVTFGLVLFLGLMVVPAVSFGYYYPFVPIDPYYYTGNYQHGYYPNYYAEYDANYWAQKTRQSRPYKSPATYRPYNPPLPSYTPPATYQPYNPPQPQHYGYGYGYSYGGYGYQ